MYQVKIPTTFLTLLCLCFFTLFNFMDCLLLCGDLWLYLYLCMFLQTALKLFIFPFLLHFLPYTEYCLCRCPAPQYLQFSINFFSSTLLLLPILSGLCLSLCIESKSSTSLILSNTAFCALCASIL